jgi:hypothetical protein
MKILITGISLIIAVNSHAGIFSSKEGSVYQTRGEALIMKNSTFTTGIERRNIPIPEFLDLRNSSDFQGLTHDSESGWTKCRVPLKGQFGLTGMTDRSLIIDCKSLQYF